MSRFIPQTALTSPKYSRRGDIISNNRKETNSRKVNPRMLDVQRIPVQVKLHGTNTKTGEKLVVKVKTNRFKKVTHTRAYNY